jgi:hypothetical protein
MTQLNYGVWISKKGWHRENGKVYITGNKEEANRKAGRVHGTSYYIDGVLIAREAYLLDMNEADGSTWSVAIAAAMSEEFAKKGLG